MLRVLWTMCLSLLQANGVRVCMWTHGFFHKVSSVISRPHPRFNFAGKKTVLPTVSGEHDSASDWLGCSPLLTQSPSDSQLEG